MQEENHVKVSYIYYYGGFMKIKNLFLFVICFLSIFLLSGCFEKKVDNKVITVEQFKSVAEKHGLKTIDNLGLTNPALSAFTQSLEEAKNGSDIKNITTVADFDMNDMSKPFYMIMFIECDSKEYAFEFYDYYKLDSVKMVGKFKQLPDMSDKCNVEDLVSQDDFKKCRMSVLDFGKVNKNFGSSNLYKIYSVRGNTVIYCAFLDRDTEKIDKLLDELGY